MSTAPAKLGSIPTADAGMQPRDLIKALLKPPIAFNVIFAELTGSAAAGLMLSQAYYWSPRGTRYSDGWFAKSRTEWKSETWLSRSEQETARRLLRKFPFWKERRMGVPAELCFKLDERALFDAIRQLARNQPSRKCESGRLESREPANQKAQDGPARKRETGNHLSLSETTPERAGRSDRAKIHRASREDPAENGAQPHNLIHKLAKEKTPTAAECPSDPLLADLWRGIFRKKIADRFFDARHLPFDEQSRECVDLAVTMLMTRRVAKMKVRADELQRRTLGYVMAGAGTVALVRDFETRRDQLAKAVHNATVRAAAELLEANKNQTPSLFEN